MTTHQQKRTSKEQAKNLPDSEVLSMSLDNPAVFEELVDRYQRAFVRKALSILKNEDDAYDVVQETFVRIYTSGRKFKVQEGAFFASWAYKILVNQCYTAYKKKHTREYVSFEADPELAEILPDWKGVESHENKLTQEYVMSLVSKLPLLLRRAVVSYFIEGKPQQDIAESEGVSNEVVRARIHRAKKELKKLHDLCFSPITTS